MFICLAVSLVEWLQSGQDEIQRNARSADICLAVSLVEWLQSGQDEIQRNARSADICLAVSLVEWLQSGQATWKVLVETVFRPARGGHQVLARDIAR